MEKSGFIDKQGNLIIDYKYDNCGGFCEDLGLVVKNGKCGFIDKKGNVVIDFKYDIALWFSNGLANIMWKDKEGHLKECGYIDRNGNEVIKVDISKYQLFRTIFRGDEKNREEYRG